MANTAALIRESIWRNKEFRALPRLAQCTFLQLCSQKDLDCAGLLTLNISVLAKGCDGIGQDDIHGDLATLEAARFIFVDEDTDELFIRSYMRTAEVVKSPNIFKSAMKSASLVESLKLRVEVAAELRRLRRAEADRVAELLDPSGTPRPDPTNPSETLPDIETLPEPSSTSTSTGTVTGTSSSSVVGYLGERPSCATHPEGNPDGTPCHGCRRARKWDETHAERIAADDLARQRATRALAAQALAACGLCDDAGWLLDHDGLPHEPAIRCQHQAAAHA